MPSQLLEVLSSAFEKENIEYIKISDLKKGKIATQLSENLNENIRQHNNGELMNLIIPLLSEKFHFGKKGKSIYLFNKRSEDIIYNYAIKHSKLTLNQISTYLPFSKEEFANSVNILIKEGSIEISIIPQSNGYGCKIIPIGNRVAINEDEEFKKAYIELLKGKSYVKIFELRRYLNWPIRKFDVMIEKLWDDGIVELQASDPNLLIDEEKTDSYLDKNNRLRILIVWRK
jgi:hypothetical protein